MYLPDPQIYALNVTGFKEQGGDRLLNKNDLSGWRRASAGGARAFKLQNEFTDFKSPSRKGVPRILKLGA